MNVFYSVPAVLAIFYYSYAVAFYYGGEAPFSTGAQRHSCTAPLHNKMFSINVMLILYVTFSDTYLFAIVVCYGAFSYRRGRQPR